MQDKKIGFVGAGNMASALIKGLLHSGTVAPFRHQASDVRDEHLAELGRGSGILTTKDNAALSAWADVIVLGRQAPGHRQGDAGGGARGRPSALVVSIAAGVPIESLEARFPATTRVIRTMPNTASLALAGATAIAPGAHATEDDLAVARRLFEATGRVVVLDETLLDAVTGLSGSGPAYSQFLSSRRSPTAASKSGSTATPRCSWPRRPCSARPSCCSKPASTPGASRTW